MGDHGREQRQFEAFIVDLDTGIFIEIINKGKILRWIGAFKGPSDGFVVGGGRRNHILKRHFIKR